MTTPVLYRKPMLFSALGLLFLALLCMPDTAHAGYLDPGSGSVLVQGIIAVMAFFGRILAKVKSIFSSKK